MRFLSEAALTDAAAAFGSTTLPDTSALQSEFWFGVDAASSRLNRATGNLATLINSPSYSPGYASLTAGLNAGASTGFTLDVNTSNTLTWLALVRPTNTNSMFVAADGTASPSLTNLLLSNGNISSGNGQTSGATDQAILPLPDTSKFTLVMGVGLLNTPSRVFVASGSGPTIAMDDGANQYLPASRTGAPIQVGGFINANFAGTFDIAAFASFTDAKGSSFLTELYPVWKAYAQSRGITVN